MIDLNCKIDKAIHLDAKDIQENLKCIFELYINEEYAKAEEKICGLDGTLNSERVKMLFCKTTNLQKIENVFLLDDNSYEEISGCIIDADSMRERGFVRWGNLRFEECIFFGDFSSFEISDVCMDSCFFHKESVLPGKGNMFNSQSELNRDDAFFNSEVDSFFYRCIFPPFNMNSYLFGIISFNECVFREGTNYLEISSIEEGKDIVLDSCYLYRYDFEKRLHHDNANLSMIFFKESTFFGDGKPFKTRYKFSEIVYDDDNIIFVKPTFVKFNFSNCDFFGADLGDIFFSKECILPIHKNFFRELDYNGLSGCRLPYGDFSSCDFNGISISGAIFTKDTILPSDKNLFYNLGNRLISDCILPEMNLSEHIFKSVRIDYVVFPRKTRLPDNPSLLQEVYNKDCRYVTFPYGDYSGYDFSGVKLKGAEFTHDAVLPQDSTLFQRIWQKSISECKLPCMDYSYYDFHLVDIAMTKFPMTAKLPNDKNFFQRIAGKDCSETVFPDGDYTEHDFTNVNLGGTKFTLNSIIPLDIADKISKKNTNYSENIWPNDYVTRKLLFEIPDSLIGSLNLEHNKSLPAEVKKILYAKYKNVPWIILPNI